MSDWDLLSAYARDQSEDAFSTLVARYVDLVYSAALRQVGNSESAKDVAQAVFV
jgi:DNA-directed RNA polymerase specialized sigma24 family protein